MLDTFNSYVRLYEKYAVTWWNQVGPVEYLTLLAAVGIIGFVSMLKSPKRAG